MTQILIIRHGETEWNAAQRVQGWTDIPLSERGHRQAARLAARLESLPLTAIYCSDLSRAQETARPLAAARGLGLQVREDLREKCYGEWEGLTLTELEAGYPDLWQRYHHERRLDVPVPGGETWPEVQARMDAALEAILMAHPGPQETVALVGHGGSLRAAILRALDAPLSVLLRLRLDNASLTRLEFGRHGGRVTLLNDTSHLDSLT